MMSAGTLGPWQCSLRSLLLVITFVCLVSAVYGSRLARDRYLILSVQSFNELMDEGRFAEAEIVAQRSWGRYPSPLTECMCEKAKLGRQIAVGLLPGETLDEGITCGMPEDSEAELSGAPWILGDVKAWEELSLTRNNRRPQAQAAPSR